MPKPQKHSSYNQPTEAEEPPLLTPQQVAAYYRVSSRTVLNWYYRGELAAAFRQGRVIRFDHRALRKRAELSTASEGDEP